MCQSKIILLRDEQNEVILEDVIHMRVEGDTVTVSRFFEEPVELRASIAELDFLKHTITLIPAEREKGIFA